MWRANGIWVAGRILAFALCAWIVAGAISAPPAGAAEARRRLTERERIGAMLDAAEQSGARFLRGGKEYSGAEGRRHLERKLRYSGSRVRTAEEFIEGIASRSSVTGQPYRVRLPDGTETETGPWFREKLTEIDSEEHQASDGPEIPPQR